MKNFPVKIEGKEYWISRSIAVVCMVLKRVNNRLYVLAEKRGKGAADNIGKLCMPCGYLDYDETLREACKREVFEETGIMLPSEDFKLITINSDPKENHQNVSARYYCLAPHFVEPDLSKAFGGEKDEVEDVMWIPVGNFEDDNFVFIPYSIDDAEWAFNHKERIKSDILKVVHELFYKD